jgi:hypothetical protein
VLVHHRCPCPLKGLCTRPRTACELTLTPRRSYPSRCSSAGTSSPRASSPSGSPSPSSGCSARGSSACGSGVYRTTKPNPCSMVMLIVQVFCLCGSRGGRSPSSRAGRWGCASGSLPAFDTPTESCQRWPSWAGPFGVRNCSRLRTYRRRPGCVTPNQAKQLITWVWCRYSIDLRSTR